MRSAWSSLLLSAAVLFLICGCDFGDVSQQKVIVDGYRLNMADDGTFAVFPKGSSAGLVITQIGWRKPYIVAADEHGLYEIFDTSNHGKWEPRFFSADQVRADPRVRDIQLISAEDAWKQLDPEGSQW